MVRIRLQILDLVLVHHPDQASAKLPLLEITLTRLTFCQFAGQSGHGQDGVCVSDHERS